MRLRSKNLKKQFNLILLFFFLFLIKPTSVFAQESVIDSLYLDSLYALTLELVFSKKDYEAGTEFVNKGIENSHFTSYQYYKFQYIRGAIYSLKKETRKAFITYKSIIDNSPKKKSYKHSHLIGLCHTELAKIYYQEKEAQKMDFHCKEALESFSPIDFDEKDFIYNIQYQYYLDNNSNNKLTLYYLSSKLINSFRMYIYVFNSFSSSSKKNRTFIKIAEAYNLLAYLYEYNNDFINAKVLYQLSFNFENKSPKVNLNNKIIDQYNLSYINFYLKDYKASELLARNIISSNAELDRPDPEIESGCLKLLGDIRIEKKDYIDALKYYEKAMGIADTIYADGNSDIQYFHEGLAKIHYELKNYPESIIEYQKAVKATTNETGKNKLNYLIGLGECYSFSDKQQAFKYFKEALGIVNHVSDIQKTEAITRINYKIGLLESDKKKAYPYHKLSRTASKKSQYPIEDASKNLIRMAHFNLENETTFLKLMDEAITSNLSQETEYIPNQIPDSEDIIFPISLLKCYHHLGDYFQKTDKEKALNHYLMAKNLIATIKPMYRYENSKSALIQESIPIYEKIISICSEFYKKNHDIKYFEWAFDALEKSKSIQLNDVINDYKAIGSAGIPDSLFEYGQQIKTKIAYHKEQLNTSDQKLSEQQIKNINNTIVELNTKYNEYIVSIENDFPEYYELKYSTSPVDIYKIQQSITEHDLVINYHLQDSLLVIFGISKQGFLLERKKIKQEKIEQEVKDLIKALYGKKDDSLREKSKNLYDILLREILEKINNIEHLIITPDRVLNYLSFEILTENKKASSQVIYSKSVVYNYSSAQVYQEKKAIRKKQRFLGIAPIYNNSEFARLPHAKKEIERIHRKLGGAKLENEEANLSNFKLKANEHSIIHIAGHAEVNSDFPLQSRLVFSKLDKTSYSLYAHELYNMKLDLDMVSLSACNSGVGLLKQGEGAMSLARGFAYAGCPSTVMTLWPMTDKPTMDIMVQYYDYLRDGLSKSQALRNAKLDYLENCGPKAEDPYFWAGIVIIGSDSPLFEVHWYQELWFKILLAVILLLCLSLIFKRFKS